MHHKQLSALIVAALAGSQLAVLSAGNAGAAFPGTNGRIVFASDRDGTLDVYVMAADGGGQVPLTGAPGDDVFPAWSRDGTKIAFSSTREGGSKIFTMNADGGGQSRVTDPPPNPVSAGSDIEPAWSKDSSRIAFRSDRGGGQHIWTVNADGTGVGRLTTTGSNLGPVWSPIADIIAFSSTRDGGDEEIYTMDAFGNNVVQQTFNDAADFLPDWSPDGTKLAFQSNLDGDFDVYVLDSSGTPKQLTNDPAFDSAPVWSPDGTKVAFQSNRDGDFEIFTMNADGSAVTQLTHNTGFDRVADWQPLVTGGGDTTPPTLTLPANLAVDATSTSGAAVTFTVSTSDAVDPNPTVVCSHTSGATFPIGGTTVTCSSTDRAGNTGTGAFTVTVRSAKAQVERLLQEIVNASGLGPNAKAALIARLQRLLTDFNPDDPTHRFMACTWLTLFRTLVGQFSANSVPPALAVKWRADASRIRAVINC